MEELLNKLIEKGWKPRGEETYKPRKRNSKYITYVDNYRVWYYVLFENLQIQREYTKRELVSKESGLWQFVCENGMTEKHTDIRVRCNEKTSKTHQDSYVNQHYEYRLIESALCDEDKLEQFLLDNIKIDVESN